MSEITVADEAEFEDTDRKVVNVEGNRIAVFNVEDDYYAYLSYCPHQGADICRGKVTGTLEDKWEKEELELEREWAKEGRILTCPRHAWEFDITTGESRSRQNANLISFPVHVDDGEVKISLD